jgi:hypothetical protein
VDLAVIALIVLVAVAGSVGLMYAARRATKSEALLADTTHGSGIFGMVGTGYAVLLAFVILVAFQGYNNARDGAEKEAVAVTEMSRSGRFFAEADGRALQENLACYGRAVVGYEWPAMDDGQSSQVVEGWVIRLADTYSAIDLADATQEAAFSQLLEQRDERVDGRRERLGEARDVVPDPVWFILAIGGLATILCVLVFTSRRERFLVQGALMGMVAATVVAGLLLVWILSHPFEGKAGSVKPVEMERSLATMDEENPGLAPPCDAAGNPV